MQMMQLIKLAVLGLA